jgi:hypothetical protein
MGDISTLEKGDIITLRLQIIERPMLLILMLLHLRDALWCVVRHMTVNPLVVSSNLTPGNSLKRKL